MIFRYVTQAGEPAECELFIGQISKTPALLFVQAPDAHPIKNEIVSLVEQALDQHFDHVHMKKIDVRVFVHYPSIDCHKNVCMEVYLGIRHRSFIERAVSHQVAVGSPQSPTCRDWALISYLHQSDVDIERTNGGMTHFGAVRQMRHQLHVKMKARRRNIHQKTLKVRYEAVSGGQIIPLERGVRLSGLSRQQVTAGDVQMIQRKAPETTSRSVKVFGN